MPIISVSRWKDLLVIQNKQKFKVTQFVFRKCRYCLQPLPLGYTSEQGIRAFDNICENKECVIKSKSACSKMLGCNHPCYGFIK